MVISKKNTDTLLYIFILLIFSFLITGYRFKYGYNYIGFDGFIDQDYGKPFVFRALIVWIAIFLKGTLGIEASKIFILLELLAFFFSGWVFSKYINSFFNSVFFSRILSFSLYFIIPFVLILPPYQPLWYPYDSYALLFNSIGLLLIRKNKLGWYYILFVISTFNREATVFLTIIFLFVLFRKIPFYMLGLHIIAQAFIWISIKLFLESLFIDKSGVLFQHQYISNVQFFTQISYELRLGTFIEFFFRPAFLIGNFGFLLLFIFIFWKKLDNSFLRHSFLVMIPFYLSMLFVANIYEYRIFGEMIPVVLMPALYIIVKIIKNVHFEIKNI